MQFDTATEVSEYLKSIHPLHEHSVEINFESKKPTGKVVCIAPDLPTVREPIEYMKPWRLDGGRYID